MLTWFEATHAHSSKKKNKNGICKCISQGCSRSWETRGAKQNLGSSLHLKSRGFGVWRTHWTGLCILKPENVSPSCETSLYQCSGRFIFIFNFYSYMFWLFGAKNWGKGGARPPGPSPCYGPERLRSDNGVCVVGLKFFCFKSWFVLGGHF